MSNIVPIDRLPQAFRDDVTAMEGQFAAALPPQIPVERFMRVVMTAVNSDPSLLDADKNSLFEAAVKAAQDGLLPDKRDGAFVVFKGKVQWMPMVGGILKKVRNSGELKSIAAHVVYSGDEFSYELGDEERIEHRPNLFGERGEPIAVYAVAKTKDGGIYREIMSTKDVEKVRSVSRSGDKGPWKDWWDEMARKTVIRRLAKRLPMSSDLDDIIRRDDEMYELNRPTAAREQSRFAARITMNEQQKIEGPREGFDRDFIDAELGAHPEPLAGTGKQEDENLDDAGSHISGDPVDDLPDDSGDKSVDPDAPASQHELNIEADAEQRQADATTSQANRDPVLQSLLTECAAKFLEIAAGKGEGKKRQDAIKASIGPWKAELPNNLDDLKKIVDRVNAAVTGKLNLPATVTMIATELGLKEADIRPTAR